MKLKLSTLAIMMATVALAGCTSESTDDQQTIDGGLDETEFVLEAGKGAIAGLLVDDRFRPIELTDNPQTEYQRSGFILLQELGLKARTDSNGEFSFVDLDPGTYTLRVQADGHEAIPDRIQVEEGLFAEATLQARRMLSQGSFVITEEQTMYIACAVDYLANGGNLPCDLDLSQDSYSSGFNTDYSTYGENVTYLITEMLANQEKRWEIQQRGSDGRYAAVIDEGSYIVIRMENGREHPEYQDNPGYSYAPWNNAVGFSTIIFVDHDFRETHQQFTGGTLCCGVGASVGIKATFLQSAFLGAPEVDIETYCALC